MKAIKQCSIRSCPLWKRVKLIFGVSLTFSPFIGGLIFVAITDWKACLFTMGFVALTAGVVGLGLWIGNSGE